MNGERFSPVAPVLGGGFDATRDRARGVGGRAPLFYAPFRQAHDLRSCGRRFRIGGHAFETEEADDLDGGGEFALILKAWVYGRLSRKYVTGKDVASEQLAAVRPGLAACNEE